MSIARTLDGKLSATLALIAIVGWLVVDIVEGYPVARPDILMVALVIGLAVIAFQFYREDRAAGKDPVVQKARIEASIEMYLDKLAQHQATTKTQKFDHPLMTFLDYYLKHKKESEESKESDEPEIVVEPESTPEGEH